MKYIKYNWLLSVLFCLTLTSCFNLDEEVFYRVDSKLFYLNESGVKGAVAALYKNRALCYI